MSHAETLRRMYQAAVDGDLDAFFAEYADDIVIHEPSFLPYAGDWSGKDGVRLLMDELGKHFDLETMTFEPIVVDGNRGLANVSVGFIGSDERFSVIEESFLREGKIAELRLHVHSAGPLAQPRLG